jgi:hypothetical protein
LLDALFKAIDAQGFADPDEVTILSLGPQPVAEAVLRRIGQLGHGQALTRALAVLGRPAPLRSVAALAGTELPRAALVADTLRAASVLASSVLLEFEHPIVRTAIYDSIPPSERAMAHARAAVMLEDDGAGAELVALHLLRSEPAADPHTVLVQRAGRRVRERTGRAGHRGRLPAPRARRAATAERPRRDPARAGHGAGRRPRPGLLWACCARR